MPEKIEDDLKTFANKLLSCIADDSEKGQNNLVEIFEEAKKKYNNEESPFWSWVYSYTRKRTEEFVQTVETLKVFPTPKIRLQEFQHFFSAGKWKTTSANTELFILLIKSVPGYEPEEDSYLHSNIIRPLRRILLSQIKLLIQEYEVSERRAAEREKELKAMREAKNKESELIYLFNDEDKAKLYAIKNPEHQVFNFAVSGLDSNESKWEITWYDFNGKATSLGITPELTSVLKRIEGELKNLLSMSSPGESHIKQKKLLTQLLEKSGSVRELKAECKKILDLMLDKTQVLFKPNSSQLVNLVSTFVIQQEEKLTRLYWYDSLGKANLLQLEDYPELATWVGQKANLSENDYIRLKVYLRDVSIRHDVDEAKQSKIQSLLKEKHGVALIATDDWTKIPSYKLMKDTYILTREPDATTGEWVLYQRQRGGINAKINIQTWPNPDAMDTFEKVLKNNNDVSAANLSFAAKEKLREIIKQSSIMSQKITCQAMNKFPSTEEICLKPGSFILTRKESNYEYYYQLYYVDSLQKTIKIDMRECPAKALSLLSKCEGEPESLSSQVLNELSKTLLDFKPASRIDLTKFSKLENLFGKQNEKKPGKLDVNNYAIAGLFGHKPSTKGSKEEQVNPEHSFQA